MIVIQIGIINNCAFYWHVYPEIYLELQKIEDWEHWKQSEQNEKLKSSEALISLDVRNNWNSVIKNSPNSNRYWYN